MVPGAGVCQLQTQRTRPVGADLSLASATNALPGERSELLHVLEALLLGVLNACGDDVCNVFVRDKDWQLL